MSNRPICREAITDFVNFWALSSDDDRRRAFGSDAIGRQCVNAFTGVQRQPIENAIMNTLTGLADYADAYQAEFVGALGDDGVLGPVWLDAMKSLMRLRNGPMGRLDAGQLGTLAQKIVLRAGFDRSAIDEGF